MATTFDGGGGGVKIPTTTRNPTLNPYLALLTGQATSSPKAYSPYPATAGVSVKAAASPGSRRGVSRGLSKFAGRKGIEGKRAGAGPKSQAGIDPLGQLYMDLIGALQQSPGQVDTADLMAQITAAINPVFDARQRAIEAMMARTEQRVGEGREDVESMYGALSEDYLKQVPEAQAQGESAEAEVEQLYGQLASDIEGHYSRISSEQEEMFKRLGIEQAAPDVIAPQAEQQGQALAAAEQLGAVNQQRYEDVGNIDATYFREGAPLARLQGSNISADMLQNLEDYLFQREQDIMQLNAERQGEISGAYSQLLGQSQGDVAEQQRWQTEMLFRALENMQEQRQWQQEFGLKQQQNAGLGQLPPDVQQAYAAIMGNPDVVAGRQTDPDALIAGTRVPITDAFVRQLATQYAQQYGLSRAEYEALVAALLEAR